MNVVIYYCKFKTIYDELSQYSIVPPCKCGSPVTIVQEREKEKVIQFLMRLDDDLYGNLRSQILTLEPLRTLGKVYAMVSQEEKHKMLTRGRDERGTEAAFVTQEAPKWKNSHIQQFTGDKPKCTHCGKMGHDASRC